MKFRLDIPAFLLALLLGGVFVYFADPLKTTKVTHPTPLNAGKITYKDKGGNCFVIRANELACDQVQAQGLKLKKQKVQQ